MNGVIKVIEKAAYLLSILIGIVIANSCTLFKAETTHVSDLPASAETTANSMPAPQAAATNYGSYLAGRVAHIRHDLNTAADYYMAAVADTPDNQMLPNQLYIILTSQGRIDEAIKYAKIAQKKGDESPFIYTLEAIHLVKNKQYQQAAETISKCDNPFAQAVFNPLITAWSHAGMNDGPAALKALAPLGENEAFKPLYFFHAGAINDYLGNTKAAAAHYTALMNIKHMELAVFPLQVITNFYLRQNEPDKALFATRNAVNKNNLMMKTVIEGIKKSDSSVAPVLQSPDIGLSDALFSIALLLQQDNNNNDLALLFSSLASYSNPGYPLPLLLTADMLEKRELYAEANQVYRKVAPDSYAAYTALFQRGKNLMRLNDTAAAEEIFRKLYSDYPPNPDILTNLGEVARLNHKYAEAAQYYQKAIDLYPGEAVAEVWPLYFAIGVSYDAAGDHDTAERYFRKVLQLRPNRMTKNHLGYILLQQNKNIEEAFELIVSAYAPAAAEGTITDSVGWAFYKIGEYDRAAEYLEKASDQASSEALIYDHLGDAYWQIGRKREAVFQWNHALSLKDNTGEFDREATLKKLENGLDKPLVPAYDRSRIERQINALEFKEKQAE